jgi:hypothetical protein
MGCPMGITEVQTSYLGLRFFGVSLLDAFFGLSFLGLTFFTAEPFVTGLGGNFLAGADFLGADFLGAAGTLGVADFASLFVEDWSADLAVRVSLTCVFFSSEAAVFFGSFAPASFRIVFAFFP